jgi:predicted GNAT superfamily acetyltransferase
MQDALNRDLPSDRLLVEWHICDEPSGRGTTIAPHPLLDNRAGKPELHLEALHSGGPLAIEVPRHVQTLKRVEADTALEWRLAVRQAFLTAFGQGYYVCDFQDAAYILLPSEDSGNAN